METRRVTVGLEVTERGDVRSIERREFWTGEGESASDLSDPALLPNFATLGVVGAALLLGVVSDLPMVS